MVFSLYKEVTMGIRSFWIVFVFDFIWSCLDQNGLRKLLPVNVSYSRVTESQLN